MKKVMIAAMAALAITGCSQSEGFDAQGNQDEISFGSIVKTTTRTDVVTTGTLKEFTVSGFKTPDAMGGAIQLGTGFMDGVTVTKNVNDWVSPTFYWPITGKVQFFATAPAQALDVEAAGYPKFDYTVGDTETQKDLIAANLIDKDKNSGKLVLPFQHLLTQVNISIKGDTKDFTYTVTKLDLTNLSDKGTFTFDGTGGVGSWSNVTASISQINYIHTGTFTVAPTADAPNAVTDIDSADKALFMLMPQAASGAQLLITYSVASTANPEQVTFNGTKTIPLTGEFGQGKKIRYTLTLPSDASPVTFGDPTVSEWGAETPGA